MTAQSDRERNTGGLASELAPLRRTFQSGATLPRVWRLEQLKRLETMLDRHERRFLEALAADLGKCRFEAVATETAFLRGEIAQARRQLRRWMRPRKVRTPLHSWPGRSRVVPRPLGVTLIISPWNYPLLLSLSPLVAALAAGNCAAIKPSEIAPHTSQALAEAVADSLDDSVARVFPGDVEVAQSLLANRFDHIFYTGSERVGRAVMKAAAEHLTPVTLELGGKSPCLVDQDSDLRVAARRIAWGKFVNAGQTCVAPDYVLAHESVMDSLLGELQAAVESFYGTDPRRSPDLARIVSEPHFRRLVAMLEDGRAVCGGEFDAGERYIAPTVLRDVSLDSSLMADEIFGPLLPVLPVSDMHEAVRFVNQRPHPLALYVFTGSRSTQRLVAERTQSGGLCVNDVVMQLAVPDLPFGGVGTSGMGRYHGQAGFDTFSHLRGELIKTTRFDVPVRYPPYSDSKLKWMRRFL